MNRAEASLAGSLIGESRLAAHFDQPIFGEVEEGEVRFTGWCLHPARELVNLSLRLNDVPFPTRFGLTGPTWAPPFRTRRAAPTAVSHLGADQARTLPGHAGGRLPGPGPGSVRGARSAVVKRRPARTRMATRLERSAGF
ncbi:MAG: hypothetical protein IPI27_05360 [Betaproteobacteria bacterium]|nr:hypothetical protein [Betaproteobacteria bacterium]